jgi:prefoldin alpha subunit
MSRSQQEQIDITKLPLQQLSEIKQEMENEITTLTGSFGTLKTALAKFNTSFNSAASLSPANKGLCLLLIPLKIKLFLCH